MTTVHTHRSQPEPLPVGVAPGTCACGCQQAVKGLRRRAANKVADRMRRDLLLLAGALADGTLQDPAGAEGLLAEGMALLPELTARVHGQRTRAELDRDAVAEWVRRVGPVRGQAVSGAVARGFQGPVGSIAELTYGGVRAPGVVTAVTDTGTTVNTEVRLRVTVAVQPVDGPAFEVTRKVLVPRVAFPRVGDAVEVAYDPADPQDFVYRLAPTAAAPTAVGVGVADDRVATLQALAELHATGVLSDAELAAEKRRVLRG